ncbi:MAG: phosphatase PAP2 family protein [Simkaniaceae bacterium]|nr:phosphatase PAP2 family protein [Simkaniaceae bacterium]
MRFPSLLLLSVGLLCCRFCDLPLARILATRTWGAATLQGARTLSWLFTPALHAGVAVVLSVWHFFRNKRPGSPVFRFILLHGVVNLSIALLKCLVGRARPFVLSGGEVTLFRHMTLDDFYHSFPSGHVGVACVTVAVCALHRPSFKRVGMALLPFVALSRLVLMKHFVGDLLLTCLLVMWLNVLVSKIEERVETVSRV